MKTCFSRTLFMTATITAPACSGLLMRAVIASLACSRLATTCFFRHCGSDDEHSFPTDKKNRSLFCIIFNIIRLSIGRLGLIVYFVLFILSRGTLTSLFRLIVPGTYTIG
jgi:hypothetical protein